MLKKREQEKMNDAQKEHDESSSDSSDWESFDNHNW